jgi:type IV pilus assembly protein PilB
MPVPLSGLARRLVAEEVISEQYAANITSRANNSNNTFTDLLLREKTLDERTLAEITADEYGLPLLKLDSFDLDSCPENIVDTALIKKHRILPLSTGNNKLNIALSDPGNQNILSELMFHTGYKVEPIVVEQDKLELAIGIYIQKQERSYAAMDTEENVELENIEIDSSQNVDVEEELDANDETPLVRFINKLLLEAVKTKASDIHFEPYETIYRVRFRIDGILHEITRPPVRLSARLTSRIKVMAQLDISSKKSPQDGRIRIRLGGDRAIDIRANTLPTVWGEKIVLRLLDPSSTNIGIDTLGMEPSQKAHFCKALQANQGLILITGPTGSGKTVSLYSGLHLLNTPEKNICTAEDPVEINIEGINQLAINPKAGLFFSSALRSFLRQDPDIIMLGEIRDLETAEMVIKAAQTGHLVLSTLHTLNAAASLDRLYSMGIPFYNLAHTISLIIAQRLARRLCSNCKEASELPKKVLKEQGFDTLQLASLTIYRAKGCSHCKNGYNGRVGFYEVVPITEELSRIIMEGSHTGQISEHLRETGCFSLREAVLLKVSQGLTSLEEANRLT